MTALSILLFWASLHFQYRIYLAGAGPKTRRSNRRETGPSAS